MYVTGVGYWLKNHQYQTGGKRLPFSSFGGGVEPRASVTPPGSPLAVSRCVRFPSISSGQKDTQLVADLVCECLRQPAKDLL
jgi:hypothetical protein